MLLQLVQGKERVKLQENSDKFKDCETQKSYT